MGEATRADGDTLLGAAWGHSSRQGVTWKQPWRRIDRVTVDDR